MNDQNDAQGVKHDAGKARFDLIDPYFHYDLAMALTLGADIHGDYNWTKVEPRRFVAALERHLNAFNKGEIFDPDSELPHMAHVAANAMFLYYLSENPRRANES